MEVPSSPAPIPIRGESEVHAAGKAASAGRGAGRGADKSAAGAVRGRGGGPRRLEGEGASDRARRRRVRCVLALERTQGPSRAFSILGALSRSPPNPSLPTFCCFLSNPRVRGTRSGNSTAGLWVCLPRPPPPSAGLC